MKTLISNIDFNLENCYYSFSIISRLNNLIQKYNKDYYFESGNYFNGNIVKNCFRINEDDIPDFVEREYKRYLEEKEWCLLLSSNPVEKYSSKFLNIMLLKLKISDYETKITEEGLLINLENYKETRYMEIYENLLKYIYEKLEVFSKCCYNPSNELINKWRMQNYFDNFYSVNINEYFYEPYGTVFDFFEYLKENPKYFIIKCDNNFDKIKEKYNIDINLNKAIIILKEELTYEKYIEITSLIMEN